MAIALLQMGLVTRHHELQLSGEGCMLGPSEAPYARSCVPAEPGHMMKASERQRWLENVTAGHT